MRQIPESPSTPPISSKETAGRSVVAIRCGWHHWILPHTYGFGCAHDRWGLFAARRLTFLDALLAARRHGEALVSNALCGLLFCLKHSSKTFATAFIAYGYRTQCGILVVSSTSKKSLVAPTNSCMFLTMRPSFSIWISTCFQGNFMMW